MKYYNHFTDRISYGKSRWKRLASAIAVYKNELAGRLALWNEQGGNKGEVVVNIWKLLRRAEETLYDHDLDKGWKYLHAAKRMEIFLLGEQELADKASVLREEAMKLRSWRKEATDTLLGSKDCPKSKYEDPFTVYTAALIRDEHYNNQAYKSSLRRVQFSHLAIVLTGVLGGLFYMLDRGILLFGTLNLVEWNEFAGIALFGLLGGTVSAIFKAINIDQSSRIPEMALSIQVTLLRLITGAASALIIVMFIRAGFLQQIISAHLSGSSYAIYALSFVSGFSERLVLRAVESVAGNKKEKN